MKPLRIALITFTLVFNLSLKAATLSEEFAMLTRQLVNLTGLLGKGGGADGELEAKRRALVGEIAKYEANPVAFVSAISVNDFNTLKAQLSAYLQALANQTGDEAKMVDIDQSIEKFIFALLVDLPAISDIGQPLIVQPPLLQLQLARSNCPTTSHYCTSVFDVMRKFLPSVTKATLSGAHAAALKEAKDLVAEVARGGMAPAQRLSHYKKIKDALAKIDLLILPKDIPLAKAADGLKAQFAGEINAHNAKLDAIYGKVAAGGANDKAIATKMFARLAEVRALCDDATIKNIRQVVTDSLSAVDKAAQDRATQLCSVARKVGAFNDSYVKDIKFYGEELRQIRDADKAEAEALLQKSQALEQRARDLFAEVPAAIQGPITELVQDISKRLKEIEDLRAGDERKAVLDEAKYLAGAILEGKGGAEFRLVDYKKIKDLEAQMVALKLTDDLQFLQLKHALEKLKGQIGQDIREDVRQLNAYYIELAAGEPDNVIATRIYGSLNEIRSLCEKVGPVTAVVTEDLPGIDNDVQSNAKHLCGVIHQVTAFTDAFEDRLQLLREELRSIRVPDNERQADDVKKRFDALVQEAHSLFAELPVTIAEPLADFNFSINSVLRELEEYRILSRRL